MTPESVLMLNAALLAHRSWRDEVAAATPPPVPIRTMAAHRQAQEWWQRRSIGANGSTLGQTPAQAAGHSDFVTDVPVQGPTDEGMRAASCWWAQNRLPPNPPCVDCRGGPIPMWAQQSLCQGNRSNGSGLVGVGESISYGGARRYGFALEGSSDPDIFASLTPAQQTWILGGLVTINQNITKTTGSACATWVAPGPDIKPAVGCFQAWYNAHYLAPTVPGHTALRTDGILDAATVCALVWLSSGPLAADFSIKFPQDPSNIWANQCAIQTVDPGAMPNPPAPAPTPTPVPATTAAKAPMSTGTKVAIGAAGVAVVAGILYAATR